jgi:hypothetical protein
LTNDFGVNWLAGDPGKGVSPLTDPFPVRSDGTRFDAPIRDALGLMARAGRGWSFNDYDREHARQQRWRIGVQRSLTSSMVFEAAYAGSYSDRVGLARNLSPLPEKYWADGLKRNDAIANDLNANVTNPFLLRNFASLQSSSPLVYQDMSTQSFYTSSTIRKSQLLRAYPQMNGLTSSVFPAAEVKTHEFQLNFERRFSKGFNLNLGYTRVWNRVTDFYFNEFDAAPSRHESNAIRPQRFVGTGIFELPFGKGRAFAQRGFANYIFGGFQMAVTYEWQPGPLLGFGNLFYYGAIDDITSGTRTLERWFNTDNFERSAAKGPAAFHRRVFPDRISGLRSDMTNQWNANVQREFKLRERMSLQVRFDAINLQNRSQFDAPNLNPFSTDFGRITQQSAALNRLLQIHGRIRF